MLLTTASAFSALSATAPEAALAVRCAVPSSVAAVIVSSPSTCVATSWRSSPRSSQPTSSHVQEISDDRDRHETLRFTEARRVLQKQQDEELMAGPACSRDPARSCPALPRSDRRAAASGAHARPQASRSVQRLLPLLQGEPVELGLLLQQLALRPVFFFRRLSDERDLLSFADALELRLAVVDRLLGRELLLQQPNFVELNYYEPRLLLGVSAELRQRGGGRTERRGQAVVDARGPFARRRSTRAPSAAPPRRSRPRAS